MHDLAERLQQPQGLSDAEMQEIYTAGVEAGIRQTEDRLQNRGLREIDHITSRTAEMADFCKEREVRLSRRERDFIDGMYLPTSDGAELTPKQTAWLLSIFRRLGGR